MTVRVAGYLILAWGNVVIGWAVLGGGPFYRAWWLILLAGMASLSLVSLMVTDPGRVSSDTTAQQLCASEGGATAAAAQQEQYFTQHCSLCSFQKPARAHHCRICNRCVLKMDHHCHWVGRCVGRGNYKAYLLVLFYGCVASGSLLAVLWRRWWSGPALSSLKTAALSLDGLLVMMIFLSVAYLLIWHGYLVTGNVTTIEYFKWKRSMRDPGYYAPPPGTLRLSEYNRGLWDNIYEALGDNVWLWLWPGFGECSGRTCCGGRSHSVEDGEGRSGRLAAWLGRNGGQSGGGSEGQSSLFVQKLRSRSGSGSPVADGGDDDDNDDDDDEGVEIPSMRSPASRSNSL